MFEDIKEGIIEDDFSSTTIQEFFETTSNIMYRDCKECGYGINIKGKQIKQINIEIQNVAIAAKNGAKAVKHMMAVSYIDDIKIKETSLNEVDKVLKRLHAISN